MSVLSQMVNICNNNKTCNLKIFDYLDDEFGGGDQVNDLRTTLA